MVANPALGVFFTGWAAWLLAASMCPTGLSGAGLGKRIGWSGVSSVGSSRPGFSEAS